MRQEVDCLVEYAVAGWQGRQRDGITGRKEANSRPVVATLSCNP